MLLFFLIFIVLFVLIFVYGGIKLAHSLKEVETQIFFWILYGISFLTVVQVAFCIFIYTTLTGKTGPGGSRGFQGQRGDKGDRGNCEQTDDNSCKTRTIAIMIEKLVEGHNNESVKGDIKNYICGFVNNPTNKDAIQNNWTMNEVRLFNNLIKNQLSLFEPNDKIISGTDNTIDFSIQKLLTDVVAKYNAISDPHLTIEIENCI